MFLDFFSLEGVELTWLWWIVELDDKLELLPFLIGRGIHIDQIAM